MISPEFSTLSTLILYALASVTGLLGMYFQASKLNTAGCWLGCIAFLCQTLFLALGVHGLDGGGLSLGLYIQLFAWFITLCSTGIWICLKQQSFLLFSSQFCLLLYLLSLPWIYSIVSIPKSLETSFYLFHIAVLFLYIAIISVGFIASVLFLYLSHRIKLKRKISSFWNNIPALSFLDKINSYCVLVAFPLYTVGIITGIIGFFNIFYKINYIDPKIIISLLAWVLLAVLFHNRVINIWKGRKPAIVLSTIFLISIFSFIIVNLFTPTMHNFLN